MVEYGRAEVTKEINSEDGTHIEQGTEFMEEGFENEKYTLHFSQDPRNRYTNGTGEYEFSLSALKDFSVPTKWAVEKELFECAKENIINRISNEEDFNNINTKYGDMDNFTREYINGSLTDDYIKKSMGEEIVAQDHQSGIFASIARVIKEFEESEIEHIESSNKDKRKSNKAIKVEEIAR